MRHDYLNLAYKVAAKTKMTGVLDGLVRTFWHPAIKKVDDVETYFEHIHKDKSGPCVRENNVNPRCDLQIIIPVYNCEKYLRECLDSVLGQKTAFGFELTIINDGSTDSSREILREYERDCRVTVIDQENQGQAAARNRGLENIVGRYIMFVDSDDSLPDGAIEKLMRRATESGVDLVAGNSQRFCQGKIWGTTHIKDLTQASTLWAKVFKADVWAKRCLPANNKFEDTVFPLFIEHEVGTYEIIDYVVYNYRDNPTSVSASGTNNPNRIETFYVTRLALASAESEGVPPTANQYKLFLHQCRHNTQRLAVLGDHTLDYLVYEEQRKMRRKYFDGFCIDDKALKSVEILMDKDDFRNYFLYCLKAR